MDDPLHRLGLLTLLLLGSAFFSASETAFFSLNFLKLRHLEARAGRRGKQVAKLMVRPKRLIITILMGNELINIAASSLVGAYFISLFGTSGQWYAIGLMAVLILVFGEITPKTLAVTYPVGYALRAAPLLDRFAWLTAGPNRLIQALTSGLVNFLGGEGEADLVTEDEFRSLVREGRKLGMLDSGEEDVIYNILELGDMPVSDLMVPRTELLAVEEGASVERLLEALRQRRFSRVPVYRGNVDVIVGVLYAKDLLEARAGRALKEGATAGGMARKPYIVPETMRCDDLFLQFRNRRVHLAVVVDEYGGTAGIVTMDDLLDRLFEEGSRGASPEGEFYRQLSGRSWSVSGRMPLPDFNGLFGTAFEDTHYKTVGGLMLHLFGRLPRPGESLRWGRLSFRVAAVEGHRITVIRVEVPKEEKA